MAASRSIDRPGPAGERWGCPACDDRRMTRSKHLGDAAEALATAGWRILARQVRIGRDELDLVALDPGPPPALVVVEVRWRTRSEFGLPEETIDCRKLARIRRAVLRLLAARRFPDGRPLPRAPVRIDVVVLRPAPGTGGRVALRHLRAVE